MPDAAPAKGPLAGIRVLELAGLGPTPFGAMVLADFGAQVVRVERLDHTSVAGGDERYNYLNRNRRAIALDLKAEQGLAFARKLASHADVLIEGFRPGTMERLGLGPADLMEDNPRLIYARMTGWGQTGPLAQAAGHDINYLAMTGALYLIGQPDRPPQPPLNLVGNFGGGGMTMVAGILAALVERGTSGRGQVIDAAMIDGASLLMTQVFAWSRMGIWRQGRGGNLLDGSAYFYRCYETADGRHIAVGALEPQFHALFVKTIGLDPSDYADHLNPAHWEERGATVAAIIRTRTRDEWIAAFQGIDACVSPVLSPQEALSHPANIERGVHVGPDDARQPAPAPRLSRTPGALQAMPSLPGEGGMAALEQWELESAEIDALASAGLLVAG
ncbi:MAG: CaiB/BaiF CoA transferase family protein [Novosphingobium meiothermophilum]|uniref:CaiB/BaiF CoA transferase family protein n=1 Tax=Novosphingobium meiothermophilum TaxID=2202251 RepID=UPI000D6E69EA|nr:CaiB/BaiF CoA-transferase family protein [Novosphingobium meiothermophilum]